FTSRTWTALLPGLAGLVMATLAPEASVTVGSLATLTLGVPLMPTFHAPLCVALTAPVIGRGSGPLMVTVGPESPRAVAWREPVAPIKARAARAAAANR